MRDRREQILARLRIIAEEIPGIKRAARNRADVAGRDRPALIVHDAAEEHADDERRPAGARRGYVTLSPQINLLMEAREDLVGTAVSELRQFIIPAIWLDDQLREIVGPTPPGDIRYMGCGLDTATGEAREAKLEIKFEFTYPLDPRELMGP